MRRVLLPLALLLMGAAAAVTADTRTSSSAAAATTTGEGGASRLSVMGAGGDDEGDALVRLVSEHWEDLFDAEEDSEGSEEGAKVLDASELVARIEEGKKNLAKRHMQLLSFGNKKKAAAKQKGASASGISETDAPVGFVQGKCAWQTYVTGRRLNVAFPDTHAVYQILVVQGVDDNSIFRIKGKYPTKGVRYFSLQSNNVALGTPVRTIVDYEVQPDKDSGVNPYVEDGPVGTYTIHVTPHGNQGLQNEIALCPVGETCLGKMNAVMIMRFYTSDPALPPANSAVDPPGARNPRLWGYEEPPSVETRRKLFFGGERWTPIKTCDQGRPTRLTNIINDNLERSIPGFPEPTTHNQNDNFILYVGAKEDEGDGLYTNMDATYLMSLGYQGVTGLNYSTKMVAKITGVLPLTARNFKDDPKIRNWQDYEVRYNSFSTITLESGGPTIDTLDDAAFVRKYENTPDWKAGNRKFSIVVGPAPGATCGLYDASADLFLKTTHRGEVADYWGVLDRQLVPAFARNGQVPDRSLAAARVQCAADPSNKGCVDPEKLEAILGDYYPRIQWYECAADGTLKAVTTSLASTQT